MKQSAEIIRMVRLLALVGILILPVAGIAQQDPILVTILESPVLRQFGLPENSTSASPVTSADLVLLGIQQNRGLRAAAARVLAARDLVPQVKALPDPRLAVVEYLDPVETRVGPQERGYQLAQAFPWFGTLGIKGDIQQEKASATQARLDQGILEVITRIRTNALELAYLDSSIAVTKNHLVLLSQWEQTAQSRYATGQGSYASLIKTQVELGKLGNRLAELEDRRSPLLAAVNADLDRSPDTPLPPLFLPSFKIENLDEAELGTTIAANNPKLTAWDHEEAASRLRGELAGKQGLPSFTLGVNYIQTGSARMPDVADSGKNSLMATVSIQVPLWRGKYRAASREAASAVAAADNSRRQELNHLTAALSQALFRYRDAGRQAELYGTALIPKAQQSMDAARAAFESGQGSFLDLIDAQRLLLEFQLAVVRARTDLLIQQTAIERLIASPLKVQS